MILILLNSDLSAAFLYLCVCRCREDNCILLSPFWLPTIVFLFLLIFFSFSITRLRNQDFVLLLFGTQKRNNTTPRLPENIFLTLFNHSGVNVYFQVLFTGKGIKKENPIKKNPLDIC